MHKMLIIDDEYLVRRGIKETIDWSRYDIKIVGEADNGLKGLELLQELKPDIVISDIKMPLLDGIEFVKKAKELNYDGQVIILSGYKDFNYSKETLEKGAFCYLLKPIDNDELISKVLDAVQTIEQKRKLIKLVDQVNTDKPVLLKRVLEQLVLGEYNNINEILDKIKTYNIEISSTGTVVFGLIDNIETIKDKKKVRLACDYLGLQIKSKLDFLSKKYNFVFVNDGAFFFLVEIVNSKEIYDLLASSILDYEKEYEEIVTIGIGSSYSRLEEIALSYQKSLLATRNKLFIALNSVILGEENKRQYKPIIYELMDYIASNYSKNISVKSAALSCFVSESYLLHTFKESVGKTFNECLTDYRILVAKKLLLKPNIRIYEIAEQVGYSDVKYFSQIFKKKTRQTPSEYINS